MDPSPWRARASDGVVPERPVGFRPLGELPTSRRSAATRRTWHVPGERRGVRLDRIDVGGFREVLRLKGEDPDAPLASDFGIPVRDVLWLSRPVDW